MTSHNRSPRERSSDALDNLIGWALYDYAGTVAPPDRVWERIERTAQCRAAAEARWLRLIHAWEAVSEWLRRPSGGRDRCYVGRKAYYTPMVFGVWDDRMPLSLVCIIQQHTPVLRFGWVA